MSDNPTPPIEEVKEAEKNNKGHRKGRGTQPAFTPIPMPKADSSKRVFLAKKRYPLDDTKQYEIEVFLDEDALRDGYEDAQDIIITRNISSAAKPGDWDVQALMRFFPIEYAVAVAEQWRTEERDEGHNLGLMLSLFSSNFIVNQEGNRFIVKFKDYLPPLTIPVEYWDNTEENEKRAQRQRPPKPTKIPFSVHEQKIGLLNELIKHYPIVGEILQQVADNEKNITIIQSFLEKIQRGGEPGTDEAGFHSGRLDSASLEFADADD